MKTELKMIKKGNQFFMRGMVKVARDVSDSIFKDGKEYIHNSEEIFLVPLVKFRPYLWGSFYPDIKIEELGVYLKMNRIHESFFCDYIVDDEINYSQNEMVKMYQYLFQNNHLDARIKSIEVHKGFIDYERDLFERQLVKVALHPMGWNNCCYYTISLKDFVELPLTNNVRFVWHQLKDLNIENHKDKIKTAIQFIHKQIQYNAAS